MSEAPSVPSAAAVAESGVALQHTSTGFVTKQTPLEMRGASDKLPAGALEGGGADRPQPRAIQPESDGPEVMMEPLRQHDPEERLRAIADAQADTDIAAARAHAASVKNHGGHA